MPDSALYFDYNASCPIRSEVISLTSQIMDETGNASSIHGFGREARKHIEDARAQIAALIHVDPQQVIFTSGATESNNLALHHHRIQAQYNNGAPIMISTIEHSSVLQTSGPDALRFPVTSDGTADLDQLQNMLSNGPAPSIVSLMLVNSETGAIQPVADAAKLAKEKGALVHSDAVQAAGRIPLDFEALGIDYMSLSAHKIGGPQGVGAFVFRKGLTFARFMQGGSQERSQRAGTENVAGIAGFGLAAEMAEKERPEYVKRISAYRKKLEDGIRALSNKAVICAGDAERVANTVNVSLPGTPAQTQLMRLDLAGIAVSSGSACSSGSMKASHVLEAMGATGDQASSAIRISMGWGTKEEDIDRFLEEWAKLAQSS